MKKGIKALLFVVLPAGLSSCSNSMSPAGYLKYVSDEDHHLKREVTVGPWEYEIQYKPSAYIIYSENRTGVSSDAYKKREETLKRTAWFNITFRKSHSAETPLKSDISGLEEYNSRLSYFSYEARKDIRLLYKGVEIEPMSYHFETNYGLTPQETIVVGFLLPDERPEHELQLSLNDRVFGNGIIKATIDPADIHKAEQIEIHPNF